MQRHFILAAIAAALAFSPFCFADTNEASEAQVVITSKRFPENAQNAAANIAVITAEDIRNSPATNLPDLLKAVPGIDIQTLYGNVGMDATINLRGFGDMPQSNTLILIDGQRLNPIDSGSLSWSTIPLNNISRIEVMPGSGAVLYGDQATGGVINIITEQPVSSEAVASVMIGSYGYGAADANLSNAGGKAYFNLAAHDTTSNGWRQNTSMGQQDVSGRAGVFFNSGRAFADYSYYQDHSGLPGSLSIEAFSANPGLSNHPLDAQNRHGYRLHPGLTYAFSDKLTLEADTAFSHDTYHSDYISASDTYERTRNTWSFTPKLRWAHSLGAFDSETVMGLDHYNGKVAAAVNGAPFNDTPDNSGAAENSTAIYAQNTTRPGGGWSIITGLRSQHMIQSARQDSFVNSIWYTCSGPCPASSGSAALSRTAYELSALYQGAGWSAYAKTGTAFRFANTDELFGYDLNTYAPVYSGILRPQHGISNEVGMRFANDSTRLKASLYRLTLVDEIDYSLATYTNVNLDPTQRTGLESSLAYKISTDLMLRLSYSYTDATFREGIYAGNELPMVAKNKGTVQLNWHNGIANYSAAINAVGKRRYSNDYANTDGYFAGYATADFAGNWDLKPWTLIAKLNNALDRHYATTAFFDGFSSNYYYPAEPRSLFVSVAYRLK
jgi:iron complex outermembrane recepter protein